MSKQCKMKPFFNTETILKATRIAAGLRHNQIFTQKKSNKLLVVGQFVFCYC